MPKIDVEIPTQEQAVDFIVRLYRDSQLQQYQSRFKNNGYDFLLQNVGMVYLMANGNKQAIEAWNSDTQASGKLGSIFLDAFWILAKRGVVRPSVSSPHTIHGSAQGFGFSLTSYGRDFLEDEEGLLAIDQSRYTEHLSKYEAIFGKGFAQKASEAYQCYKFGCYLACCVLSGAATESVLLKIAELKLGETEAREIYYHATGRRALEKRIISPARSSLKEEFHALLYPVKYWRDESSHAKHVDIAEPEAYISLLQLLGFCNFAHRNWAELTKPEPVTQPQKH